MINSEPIPLTLPLSAPKTSEQVISQRANVVRELSLRHNREVYPEPQALYVRNGVGASLFTNLIHFIEKRGRCYTALPKHL